jgi:hypothetical protein
MRHFQADLQLRWFAKLQIHTISLFDVLPTACNFCFSFQAEIKDNQLLLAYEPEVASIFCKECSTDVKKNSFMNALNPGQKFMVLDLGGT